MKRFLRKSNEKERLFRIYLNSTSDKMRKEIIGSRSSIRNFMYSRNNSRNVSNKKKEVKNKIKVSELKPLFRNKIISKRSIKDRLKNNINKKLISRKASLQMQK